MKNVWTFLFCVLLIAYGTFKKQKLTQSALKTVTFLFQVSKKNSFKIHEKLKRVCCCVYVLLWKLKIWSCWKVSVFLSVLAKLYSLDIRLIPKALQSCSDLVWVLVDLPCILSYSLPVSRSTTSTIICSCWQIFHSVAIPPYRGNSVSVSGLFLNPPVVF